ncbi:hypothetical protein HJFPF1_01297 [Paramyrothecium foliicola]|nr:hypothetical protein HJFPF1_01297 [Paramyrothecium foliicola]
MSGKDDVDDRRRHERPYSAKHPIPTISRYRSEKAARQENAVEQPDDANTFQANGYLPSSRSPRPSHSEEPAGDDEKDNTGRDNQQDGDGQPLTDTSQVGDTSNLDPKKRVKEMKNRKKERADREVTDPVTHLPVKIHDFTDEALEEIDFNDQLSGSNDRTATGFSGKSKSDDQLQLEKKQLQDDHTFLANRFPPPDFDALRGELATISQRGVSAGLVATVFVLGLSFSLDRWMRNADQRISLAGVPVWMMLVTLSGAAIWAIIGLVRGWIAKRVNGVFQDEIWDAQRRHIIEAADKHEPETTAWLNSLLSAVWPLVNPDLFSSLADMLEDVMQASIPGFIKMVSVDDVGQGSEAVRILGVRWLPTGAAASSVTEDGKLVEGQDQSASDSINEEDKALDSDQGDESDGAQKIVANSMEAEEGDFVNMEVAFAYRTRSSSKSLKERTKDMHLYIAFYLMGSIKFPVWVDLQGLVGTMRMRLQLTPDPPFFGLCTLTFLGQPKVDLKCTPLSKHGLNIMDVPFISKFVQSSVDAAMSEYVAPKSLTLDLKDMLAGDDFKKDTTAKGVLMINIKRGYDFKIADTGIPLIKDGNSDPYVSVGWAKFGKVLWSTRVMDGEMEPYWDETVFVLVTPEELDIDERLRVQLWDSDRFTADDDLGRIELSLKELMKNEESNGKMWHRSDGFRALKAGDNMPGRLEWSVGYYSKTRLQQCQYENQTYDPEVRSFEQLREKVNEATERKLRESMIKEGRNERDENELEQQRAQELKAEEDAMMISAPPPDGYPSGIFSLQIHNIVGLELGRLNKQSAQKDAEASDEEETGDGLPSAYCTVIVNHRKTFKTRTKPQNSKPFYNAGCERFIRDWRDCEVYVSVRDARLHEDDALLGVVQLPLYELFKERSQVMQYYPLTGGVGHGRIRLSMVWRSVQLQAPPSLLGWELGTLEVQPTITSLDCPDDLKSAKLKLKTNISSGKMYASDEKGVWRTKKDQSLRLAVQKRYASCLSIAFKQKSAFKDDVRAFSTLWFKDIPDEEEQELELPVWKGDYERARTNCLAEPGERVGTIKLKVTFWAGMGGAHSRWASSNQHLKDIVEVIDTARDNLDQDKMQKKAGIVDEEDTSDSDISDSDDDNVNGGDKDSIPDGSSGNKQGPIDQIRDYKKHDKTLHRQHRGIMQWKIPRTAKWMKNKVSAMEDRVTSAFDHRGKGGGIETEA